MSDTVCPRCGVRYPWHSTDCVTRFSDSTPKD
jgi:ribosomal protein L40E